MAGELGSAKSREWQARFERYRLSGTTVANFCRRERVSVAAFYYWRREVGCVETARTPRCDDRGDFTPVRLVGSSNVQVHLPGGTRLEIPLVDCEAFERALQTLVAADARRREDLRC